MARSYPYISEKLKLRGKQASGLCVFCGQPRSDMRLVVQVNWFRGDDEVFKVHGDCIKGKHAPQLIDMLKEKGQL